MKKIPSIVIAAVLAVSLFTSCATDQGGNVGTFWNSPAVQAELQTIQSAAFTFINAWLSSHVGATRSASAQNAAIDACVADLKTKHPNAPDAVLRGAAQKAVAGQ